ncbi:DNA polymerase III subunit chi [Rhodoferax sp.]|uniref:DNA polymerase III subunit chi n=1 Tax=Rhodoferax sp. TaxID=50421 RepID=UPI0027655CC0|nr:DNA polymerase III subunit chi [Rhodoferax sp.]
MTAVAFHFNVNDRLAYACRWLRKAVNQKAQVVVIGMPETLRTLDRALWAVSETEFLPHCLAPADPYVVVRSPIVLASSLDAPAHRQLLLNLGEGVPAGFEQFERVTEVVAQDETERQMARDRWKHYLAHGCGITRHDLSSQGGQ